MPNASPIAHLQAPEPLPPDGDPALDTFPLATFDGLVRELVPPLRPAHVLALLNLGPPLGTPAYEVEWALVHAAETAPAAVLREVLSQALDTEVCRLVLVRLANYPRTGGQ